MPSDTNGANTGLWLFFQFTVLTCIAQR